MECRRNAVTEERSIENKAQKRKRTSKIKANMKRLKAEVADIGEQQKRIKEGQKEVREKFEEIEFECDQLRKETFLISQQAALNQQRLDLMFKIVKAREDNNFSEADKLTQCLRELMHDEANMKNNCDYVQMQGMKKE